MKNLIGITMGDPKGVGPEIVAKAWHEMGEHERESIILYGDLNALTAAAELTGAKFNHKRMVITSSTPPPVAQVEDHEAARLAISAIDAAVADVTAGKISAIVTAPVNKRRMQLASPGFAGHTEYLAKAARAREPVMMFASESYTVGEPTSGRIKQLCFAIVTRHISLRDVPAAITTELVLTTIRQTHLALDAHFACPDARIGVMSLNPHGGEGGSLGHEEKEAIAPAIRRAVKEGINCVGPLPADSLFRNMEDFDYDAVVAMYHDQGLIPAKILCQSRCVNITLGLPYIRTSPGHGTAEDIAWLGTADSAGMLAAIRMARRLLGWKISA